MRFEALTTLEMGIAFAYGIAVGFAMFGVLTAMADRMLGKWTR